MKKNLLVTLADENYVEQAKQLFSSVYFNAGWKGDYMLLAHEIPEKKLEWFRKKGILIKKCKPFLGIKKIKNWPVTRPVTILDKLYLFTPYFKKWKNVVFLDADIIVRASLDELTKIKGFAAVLDAENFTLINQLSNVNENEEDSYSLSRKYYLEEDAFNSGAMVFSTNVIEKDSFSKIITLFKETKKVNSLFVEQVVLNFFFNDGWIKLPLVYNLQYPFSIKSLNGEKNVEAVIIHFGSNKASDKPWSPKNYFYKEWKSNLEKAELIDLKKPQISKKWSKEKIEKKSKYYWRIIFIWLPIKNIKDINRFIGAVGFFLKNNLPKAYFKLRKLKSKLKKAKC